MGDLGVALKAEQWKKKPWKWCIPPPPQSVPGMASFHSRCCIAFISLKSHSLKCSQILPVTDADAPPASLAHSSWQSCTSLYWLSVFKTLSDLSNHVNLTDFGIVGGNNTLSGSQLKITFVTLLAKRLILLHWAGLSREGWCCRISNLVVWDSQYKAPLITYSECVNHSGIKIKIAFNPAHSRV